MIHKGLSAFLRGVDLNVWLALPAGTRWGHRHVHWQDAVRAVDGLPALEHVRTAGGALPRRSRGPHTDLCRAVSGDGVRTADLSREPARYRDLPVGASRQALPYGLSRAGQALDALRRERGSRLAHLGRTRPAPDRAGEEALCQRRSRP